MPQSQPGLSGFLSMDQMQETMLHIAYNICSIITMPLETFLRPFYGTLYIPAPIAFFSVVMMILLPVFGGVASHVGQMLPMVRFSPPRGLISLGAFSRIFLLASMFYHGPRLWRRMLNMQLEQIAGFEGPPLPFFRLLPGGGSFWKTRILLEPAFVFVLAYLMGAFFIFESGLTTYLEVAAVLQAFKQYLAWYLGWRSLRQLMDQQNIAPIIASIVQGTATDEDLAPVHLASLPKDMPAATRQSFSARLARFYSTDAPGSSNGETDHDSTHPSKGI